MFYDYGGMSSFAIGYEDAFGYRGGVVRDQQL